MTTELDDTVPSPCVGVCTMSEATGLCLGCYRTLDEIRNWWDMSPQDQRALIATLEKREQENNVFGD